MKRSNPITLAFLVVLVDLIGFGMMIPVQPFYAESLGATPATITLLAASYSLMQFIFAPMWGSLSDIKGRRPVILLSITITMLGHLTFGLSTSLLALFIARSLSGFGAANISTAQAIIADVTPPEDRTRGMGIIGAAFGLGFIIGPAFGGLLSQISPIAPAFAAALLSGFNLVFAMLFLPETKKVLSTHGISLKAKFAALKQSPTLIRRCVAVTFFAVVGFSLMEQALGLYIQEVWTSPLTPDRLAKASHLTAIFLVAVGLMSVFTQGFLIRKLSKRFTESKLIQSGLIVLALTLVILPLIGSFSNFSLFVICGTGLSLGTGLLNPSLTSLISKTTSDDHQGMTLSLNQSGSALARIVGPSISGFFFQMGYAVPFLIGSLLMGVSFFVRPKKLGE